MSANDYEKLTADNFIVEMTNGSTTSGGTTTAPWIAVAKAVASFSPAYKTYDNSTGILNITGSSYYGSVMWGAKSEGPIYSVSTASSSLAYNVYLVY